MKGGVDFREALKARLDLIQPSLIAVRNFVKDNPPLLSKNIRLLSGFHNYVLSRFRKNDMVTEAT